MELNSVIMEYDTSLTTTERLEAVSVPKATEIDSGFDPGLAKL